MARAFLRVLWTTIPSGWQLSVPVFSLATVDADGMTNMNIVTYASAVGIKPERLWVVSLYKVTSILSPFFIVGSRNSRSRGRFSRAKNRCRRLERAAVLNIISGVPRTGVIVDETPEATRELFESGIVLVPPACH